MNIINAAFVRNGVTVRTLPVYQYNRGMILQISGLDDLPSTFRADFSNAETGQSKTVIGTDGQVHVPYEYFVPGATIHCWLVWSGEDYTVTRKHIMIPIARRATPTDEEPTPDEQGVIDQAIAALNDAVTQTGQDVEAAAGYAGQAEQSAQAAADAKDAATDAKDAAVAAQNAAEAAKDQAVQSATAASASAQSASESAQSAFQSKTDAQAAAARATQSADAAQTSAGNAQTSAQSAQTAADQAQAVLPQVETIITESLQQAKESGEFDGPQGPKGDKGDTGATGPQGPKGDPGEVTQAEFDDLAGDVADLKSAMAQAEAALDEKAAAIHTAAGPAPIVSIPDAAAAPVDALTVGIEPVQDLHGYDSPWPAGGTKNKMPNAMPKTETINGVTFKLDEFGVFTVTGTATDEANCDFPIGYSFVIPDGDPKPKFALNNTQSSSALFKFFNNSIQIDSWGIVPSYRTAEYSGMQGKTCNSYRITVPSGAVVNMTISPMIVENSVTDYTYIPYSNICPITGWTGAKVTRTGKNLLPTTASGRTYGGITYTVNSDGSIHVEGTATSTSWLNAGAPKTFIKAGTYTLSGGATNCGLYIVGEFVNGGNINNVTIGGADSGSGKTFTLTDDANVYYQLAVSNGTVIDTVIYPMLTVGSSIAEFATYNGTTYPITFPTEAGTVYGGTLDVVSGKLTVDRVCATKLLSQFSLLGDVTKTTHYRFMDEFFGSGIVENNDSAICNAVPFTYNSSDTPHFYIAWNSKNSQNRVELWVPIGTSTSTEIQICAKLKTGVSVTLTPQEIRTLLGVNNIWADTGDVTVGYKADTKLYIDVKIAAAIAAALNA